MEGTEERRGGGRDRGQIQEEVEEEYITVPAWEHKPLLIYYHFNNYCCSDERLHELAYVCYH